MPPDPFITPEQMKQVLDVTRMLAVSTDLDPLLLRIAEATTAILACDRASIFLHDPQTHELWTKIALKHGREIRVPADSGIVGHCFTRNQLLNVPDPYADLRFNPDSDHVSGFITRNLLAAPMVDLDGRPLGVIQSVNKKSGSFTINDQSLLQLLADQAGVAIQRYRLQVAAMEIVMLRREMELARRVQEQTIPTSPPKISGLSAAGRARPASITGGDCFDLWQTRDGRLGIFLADACGHGLAPALVVSQARTLVRTLAETEADPHQLLNRINARFFADLEPGKFVTAFLGFVGPDGSIAWASAGHGPVMIRRALAAPIQIFDPPAPPLAVLEQFPDSTLPFARLEPGGWIAVLSDGLTEAVSPAGEQFGGKRIASLLTDFDAESPGDPGADPHAHVDRIFAAVENWQHTGEIADDQTMVIVRRDAADAPLRGHTAPRRG